MNNKIDQQKKCDAKSKRTGDRCRGLAMPNGKCRVHGGKSLVGVASPLYKDGRFSIAFPAQIAAQIQVAKNDSQLTEMREELATIDFWIRQRIAQAYNGETMPAWTQIQSNYKFYRNALEYLTSVREKK